MRKVDIIVDTLDEYWNLKDRMQSTVSNIMAEDVTIHVNEDDSNHVFDMRKLEEGKYVYYETDKEKVC